MHNTQLREEEYSLFPQVIHPKHLAKRTKLTIKEGLQRLVELDRYSLRDNTLATLKEGDLVIAEVKYDPKYPIQGYGTVTKLDGDKVTVNIEYPESAEDNDGNPLDLANLTVHKHKIIKPLETYWEQIAYRAAKGASSVEKTRKLRRYWFRKFFNMLKPHDAVPGGRILYGAGSGNNVTLFNCFVLSAIPDSRRGISRHRETTMEIMSRGGGVGSNGSTLRPKNEIVQGVNGKSSGAVSWLDDLSKLTDLVQQGGCVAPYERVLTSKGWCTVESIFNDPEQTFVQTHKGLKPITAKFDNGVKPVYKLTTEHGYALDASEDHKFGVVNADGSLSLVPLKDLKEGDNVAILKGFEGFKTDFLPLDTNIEVDGDTKSAKLPSVLTDDVAFLMGYHKVAGGIVSASEGGVLDHLFFNDSSVEEKIYNFRTEKLHNAFSNAFNIPLRQNGNDFLRDSNYDSFSLDNPLVNEFFSRNRLFEDTFKLLASSPRSVALSFLRGLFEASCRETENGTYVVKTLDWESARYCQLLFLKLGIESSLSNSIVTNKYNEELNYAVLELTGGYMDILMSYSDEEYAKVGYVKSSVKSIEFVDNMNVYDFEVEDVHMLSFMGLYTSNSRRGAQMIGLGDWHPDLVTFMMCKIQNPHTLAKIAKDTESTEIAQIAESLLLRDADGMPIGVRDINFMTGANISVLVSDDFMQAVEADGDWTLRFPDINALTPEQKEFYDTEWHNLADVRKWEDLGYPTKEYQTYKAKELWDLINIAARYSAEPGVIYIDTCNNESNCWYYAPLVVTNPCGEQPLPPYAVCNLIAINLANFYNPHTKSIDYPRLRRTVHVSQRFADNIIDHSFYFLEENERMALNERRVGKGVMGLADLLIDLELPYGSEESLKEIDELFAFIKEESYIASANIAEEKGSFPLYEEDKLLQSGFMKRMPENVINIIKEKGLRNVCSLTVAPTGSTGTMVGVGTGLEPYYGFKYYRSGRLGKYIEVNTAIAQRYFDRNPEATELPSYYVAATDLSPLEHVRVQAVVQRHIDSAISKTCNAPSTFTVEDNKELYMEAYKLGCKGVTVYVDGSRDTQVLNLEKKDNEFTSEDTPNEEPNLEEAKELVAMVVGSVTDPAQASAIITDMDLTQDTRTCEISFDPSGNMIKECH